MIVLILISLVALFAALVWAEDEIVHMKQLRRSRLLRSISHLPPDTRREILLAHELQSRRKS